VQKRSPRKTTQVARTLDIKEHLPEESELGTREYHKRKAIAIRKCSKRYTMKAYERYNAVQAFVFDPNERYTYT
jgi:hypothetical protein